MSEQAEVSPESDMLLQLIVDAVEARLRRADDAPAAIAKGRLRSVST